MRLISKLLGLINATCTCLGCALDLLVLDLIDIDLSDSDLDFLGTYINSFPVNRFFGLQDVLKTCQDVLKTSSS